MQSEHSPHARKCISPDSGAKINACHLKPLSLGWIVPQQCLTDTEGLPGRAASQHL